MNNLDFINYFFKKAYKITFVYFTFWALFLQFLYYIGVLRSYQESVLLVTLSVSFVGIVLTYIYPERLKLMFIDFVISKNTFQLVDLVFHQLPLLIFLIAYDTKIKADNLVLGVVLLLIYVILNNPYNVYSFKCACAHKTKNNVHGSIELCECRDKYNLGIGMIICYFMIIILAVKLRIFA